MLIKIFDIQRFSLHDGPGIRTVVFLKGCPLHCIWCHNPESQDSKPQLAFYKEKCCNCGLCSKVCSNHIIQDNKHILCRDNCRTCSKCVSICPNKALELVGKNITTQEVLKEVLKDNTFYQTSGGGLTLSGGEPLFQPQESVYLLKMAKEQGLNTCVETCGFGKSENLIEIAKYTDLFLYDLKETNPEKHKAFTGVDNRRMLENLKLLNDLSKQVVLRCPIIPSLNNNEYHYDNIAKIASKYENIIKVEIMAYHKLGNQKYDAIDKENKFNNRPNMELDYKKQIALVISKKIKCLTSRKISVE